MAGKPRDAANPAPDCKKRRRVQKGMRFMPSMMTQGGGISKPKTMVRNDFALHEETRVGMERNPS
jgi:hypothetical protein